VAFGSQYPSSGLNVWFKDDIQNALRAIDTANADLFKTINTPEMHFYRRGYEAALRAIAEAFGIRYESPVRRYEEPLTVEVKPY
jgi:hypothetical protein